MNSVKEQIELLAPAGSLEAFRAALYAGADAIYLGVDKLNARRSAQNFKLDDLAEICRLAHLSKARVYLTLNIIIKEEELEEALQLVHDAYLAGVDAFIIQDWGLLAEIAQAYPEVELHISTQANVHDVAGVRFARDMGATRVTTSRELSLFELKKLAEQGVDIEAFGHGALCICYSGQCLMSSMIGQRSANRGRCAQPCRLTYELLDDKGRSVSTVAGEHLLSPKDLSTIDILPQLIESGVRSLKVEGRMKSAEYVGTVVSTYRAALDRALADPAHYQALPQEKDALTEAFSRGFSEAYMSEIRSNEMMSYQRPNNRGIQVARVAARGKDFIELVLDSGKDLWPGDILEYWTSKGRYTEELASFELVGDKNSTLKSSIRQKPGKGQPKQRVRFKFSKAVSVGDRVFRVRSARIAKQIEEHTAHAYIRTRPVSLHFKAELGKQISLHIADKDGHECIVYGPVAERARTKALSLDEAQEHLSRFGGSPFYLDAFSAELDESVGMGFSILHKLRKQAADDLEKSILHDYENRNLERKVKTSLASVFSEAASKASNDAQTATQIKRKATDAFEDLKLCAFVKDVKQAQEALDLGIDHIYVAVQDFLDQEEDFSRFKDRLDPSRFHLLLDEVSHDKDLERMLSSIQGDCAVAVANVSQIKALQESAKDLEVWNSIPAINSSVCAFLYQLGAKKLWLSPELSLSELEALTAKIQDQMDLGIVISGAQQLMVSEHCVLMSMGPCNEDCPRCSRRKKPKYLKDRKSYCFPVYTDSNGRCHIYNSVSLDISPELRKLYGCGLRYFMLDLRFLDSQALCQEIEHIHRQIKSLKDGKEALSRLDKRTAGHMYRGIE